MAHHKRKRPKSSRAGCLTCKYWKHQRAKGKARHTHADRKRMETKE